MPSESSREQVSFPIACWLTVLFPVLLLNNVASDIALCVIAILFLKHCYLERRWEWLKEGWVRALLLLWLYMNLRGVFAGQPKEALARAAPFIRYIVFAAALARWTLKDETTRARFLRMLTCAVIFFAADGLLQDVASRDLLWHRLIHDPNNGHIRLAGPFSRPILGIMLAWLLYPAVLPLLLDASGLLRRGKKLFQGIVALLLGLTAIALAGERIALLLTIAGFVLAVLLMRLHLKIALAAFAGFSLVLASIAFLSHDMASRQLGSTSETLHHWQDSPYGLLLKSDLILAAERPIVGLGANHFRIACAALYPNDEAKVTAMCNTHPHNLYFEWLIEEGIIGLLLFSTFVLLVLKNSASALLKGAKNPVFAGAFVAFTLRVWPLMTTTDFFSRWGAPPFWLVLGALLVYTPRKGDTNAGASFSVQDAGL